MAVALAVAASPGRLHSIYFTSLDDMVRNLTAAEAAAGRLTSKLGSHLRPAVLVPGRGRPSAARPRGSQPGSSR
ncbi:ATP-binding protein [Streptomyces tricolor]|nr:ATP-binding protein [Streptomyces tricolor]